MSATIEDFCYTKKEHYDILKTIKNWSKNRPPDETRVEDIKVSLIKRQPTHSDGIILVWEHPDDSLECFDGIHRLQAIMGLEREECEDTQLLIRHYKNHSEGQIIDEFMRINKSVSVSSIYTKREAELEMRLTIESVMKHLQTKYPEFFKPSAKPNIPHTNRDVCMESMYEMIKSDERKRSWKVDRWLRHIQSISETIKQRIERGIRGYKITRRGKEKCERYDFWTFAHKQWWFLPVNSY